jgi:hypothetical protein
LYCIVSVALHLVLEEIVGLDIAAHGEEGYRILPRVEWPEISEGETPEEKVEAGSPV